MAGKTEIIEIAVADFSEVPFGRFQSDGPNSGTRFREEILLPNLQKGSVAVDIDGAEGYGSSFLDEAFGGLIRKKYFTSKELRDGRLTIICKKPLFQLYPKLIWKYIDEAKPDEQKPA